MEVIKWGLVALVASCAPAYAQENCAPTPKVYEILAGQFQEQRMFLGLTEHGAMVEMWGNPETDTWSLIITRPDGISCAPAVGVGFEFRLPVTGDPA